MFPSFFFSLFYETKGPLHSQHMDVAKPENIVADKSAGGRTKKGAGGAQDGER